MGKAWYKSFSAWTTIIGVIGTILCSVWGMVPAALALKISVGLIALIVLMRQLIEVAKVIVKLTPSTKDDEYLAKIEILEKQVEDILKKAGINIPEVPVK